MEKKKRAGRKRLPAKEKKGELIPVRCTAEQKAELTEKAKRRGVGVSTWLLMLGMSEPDKPGG